MIPPTPPSASSDRQSFTLEGFSGSVRSIKDESYDEGKKSAVAESRKMRPRTVDDDNDFWSTYVVAAGESDRRILETWNKTLDSLLTFAALFSAINTAFIMESYKRLQPDSTDTTNSLLRALLRHRNDNLPLLDSELGFSRWKTPLAAFRINSTLFSSLACSLLASFGAVLGKEMLAEYGISVALTASASPDQGRTRQRKFDGLEKFRFRILMQMLPALLQLSLALFLVGLVDFIWLFDRDVATVFMVPVTLGLVTYLVSLIIALHYEDSPFQTSLSASIRLIRRTVVESDTKQKLSRWMSGVKPSIANASTQLTEQLENIPYIRDRLLEAVPQASAQLSFSVRDWINRAKIMLNRWGLVDWCRYIFFPLYILRLGIMGQLVTCWKFIHKILTLFSPFDEEENGRRHSPKELQSSDCAVWLLRNGHHADVMRKALKAFPLLPADILLKKQKSAVEPYASIYTSSLNRRPGDVEFRWDKDAIADAIIAGTALFHVLKSRDEVSSLPIRNLSFQIDPDIYDAIDGEQSAQFDFPLATVILCVQTQMGVTDWNIGLLSRLLSRYLVIVRTAKDSFRSFGEGQAFLTVPVSTTMHLGELSASAPLPLPSSPSITSPYPQDAPFTAELMPPPINLLLDAVIYCSSQRYHWDSYYTVLRRFEHEYEKILEILQAIMEERSDSMAIAGHIALVVATTQWYKQHDDHPELTVFNKVKLPKLRSAWLTIDKRATFFENIVLAFSMVSKSHDSPATMKIYSTLLDITEHFLPRAMDASDKSEGTWKQWWPKIVKMIPGLLRFVRQVGENDHRTIHTALRVIARLLPDDWDLQKTQRSIATFRIPPDLYSLSPLNPDHDISLSKLIASVFSSMHPASPQTRSAAAEVLGWMILFPGVDSSLPALINHANKGIMYNQLTGIPSFLMSMWVTTTSRTPSSQSRQYDYFERYFSLFLNMEVAEGSLAYTVQLEALAIALSNFYKFPYAAVIARPNFRRYLPPDVELSGKATVLALWEVLNNMLEKDQTLAWPESFTEWGLNESGMYDDKSLGEDEIMAREEKQKALRKMKDLNELKANTLWSGEGLMLIWQKVGNLKMAGGCRYFYREDVIKAVIDGFHVAYDREAKRTRLEISFGVIKEYLEKVLDDPEPSGELKVQVHAALMELASMTFVNWEPKPSPPTTHRRVSLHHETR